MELNKKVFISIVAVLSLTLIGCGENHSASPDSPPTPVNSDTELGTIMYFTHAYEFDFYPAIGTRNGKRAYVMHGLRGSKNAWKSAPYSDIVLALQNQGTEVVAFTLPYGKSEFWFDGGKQYRKEYAWFLNHTKAQVEELHGTADFHIVGGVSWGGLHTLMAIETTDLFDAYFALVPVTYVSALNEYKELNNAHFNPFLNVSALSKKPGIVIWGTLDTRVDYVITRELSNQIKAFNPASYTGKEVVGMGHGPNAEAITAVIDWAGAR